MQLKIQTLLIEKMVQADRAGANELLDGWAAENGYERLLPDILDPVLIQIGEAWRTPGSVTLAQAYVAAKVAEDVMGKIAARSKQSLGAQPQKGPVVIGNIEEDFHALGRKMVGTFLRTEGWMVHDLGNDVLAEGFVDKALEVGARVIGVSAMMMTTAGNIKKVRALIDDRGLTGRIQLAIGGAVFRICPGLVEEIGGDGTALDALGAAGLFDRLWEDSVRKEAEG
jgi:methanogenic corrinoid protein MtbC1